VIINFISEKYLMPKIITVTFSPCIDKSTSVPELIPEKKLKCTDPKLDPGGGGINVARAIKKLDGEAIAIYPVGGFTGKYFNELLANEKVPSIIIETKNETRENVVVLDESTNQQYRFGMPGTELTEQEWKDCLQAINEIDNIEYIVASGSLPPGVPLNIYAHIAVIAKKKNARLIVDTSGEALKHAANEGVYLLKPNLGELSSLMGIKKINVDEIEKVARSVIEKGHCEMIVVSMGENGAILVTNNEAHHISPPKVIRKSTVGAGDSMVAGIVLALSQNRSFKEVLQFGVACGTAATMNSGTELCRKDDVNKLFEEIGSF
jgi:6-phosphofructokinase 2